MDSTYAPQSPDLSGFQSSPSKQQHLYQPQPTSQSASYAPRSPEIPAFTHPPQQYTNAYQQNSPLNSNLHLGGPEFSGYGNTQYRPAIPALPPSHSFGAAPNQNHPSFYPQPPLKQEHAYNSNFDGTSEYTTEYNTMASRTARAPRVKDENSFAQGNAEAPAYKNPNPNNIEIKTKFPVARIKRIMQADEEVGKVAQVTPVAVNKALELFMIALVSGAADKAREKGGKRVTAQHLKAVVEGDNQFDFLNEIVQRVADVQENAGGEGRKRKEKVKESDSDEEDKKPKKGKGRKKKSDD